MIAAASPEQGGLRFDLQVIASWIEPGSRVLDAGSGLGTGLHLLDRALPEIEAFGTDIDPQRLLDGRRAGARAAT